jgi:dienelactone hydrolase
MPLVAGAVLSVATAGLVIGLMATPNSSRPAHAASARATTTTTAMAPVEPSSAPTTTVAPAGPPYAIASDTITLVDPSRPSPARGSVPGSSTRTLRTVVRRPVDAPGPLPLVVFGPGFDTTPETYEPLLDAWAAAGYLVAAPDFPGSGSDLPGPPTESDIPEQARDLSFVVSSLLGGREGPVDPARIAVAGHSDGGSSVVVLAEHPGYGDPRISAYLVLAGQIPDGVAGPWDAQPAGALLCIVGTADQYGNLSLTTAAYDSAHMPKALVTVPGGDHEGIFLGAGAVPEEMRALTLRFLALALGPGRPVTDPALAGALATPAGSPQYSLSTG